MKTKQYKCSICGKVFELAKNTNKKALLAEIMAHAQKHMSQGQMNVDIPASNYRATYVCTCCGKRFRQGSKGYNALKPRIVKHAMEACMSSVVPEEFIDDEEWRNWV